ncbi:hypothetical protein GCM10017786_39330 [Amycolatopsis deserti]|uniref:DUF742 domain-containing protein n=1 Tax=Amycolatopsis deserti TaxID=185696 RepID=A0ABQ3J4K6_9PSEU|nr:DUF742 domain-containing protein [Amycolatopsis deserti]GHF02233.1 hypothetical protein GCM10017786_39330 [Amycolatopsis deserti]
MRGLSQGAGRPGVDAWDRLHQGTEREGIDSPARFVLTKKPVVLPVRTPVRTTPGVGRTGAAPAAGASRAGLGAGAASRAGLEAGGGAAVGVGARAGAAGARARGGTGAGLAVGVPPAQSRGQETSVRTRMMMRPYARTGGRTRPDYELALEALVSTTDRGRVPQAVTGVQHRRICGLCAEPRSIAEIAAYLDLPLNVVKVLVSDLDNAGLVLIHQSGLSFGDRSSREFMNRVLQGLRRL